MNSIFIRFLHLTVDFVPLPKTKILTVGNVKDSYTVIYFSHNEFSAKNNKGTATKCFNEDQFCEIKGIHNTHLIE